MKIYHFLTVLPFVLSLAMTFAAQAQAGERSVALARPYQTEGREVAAPSWSDACMTDHGPSQCGEPMWVYGSPAALSRYKSAF
jgi:hypothetical protein